MGSAISLRSDFDGNRLRLLARQTKDASQARRLLALASIYDGGSGLQSRTNQNRALIPVAIIVNAQDKRREDQGSDHQDRRTKDGHCPHNSKYL